MPKDESKQLSFDLRASSNKIECKINMIEKESVERSDKVIIPIGYKLENKRRAEKANIFHDIVDRIKHLT